MKKILAVVLALVLCMALCAVGSAAGKYKIGILAPAVTHGWVAGVAYNAGALRQSLLSRSGKAWKCRFRTRLIPTSRL